MSDPRATITHVLSVMADVDTRPLPEHARAAWFEATAALREARRTVTPEHLLTPTY